MTEETLESLEENLFVAFVTVLLERRSYKNIAEFLRTAATKLEKLAPEGENRS